MRKKPKQARDMINKSWNSLRWPTFSLASDEESVETEMDASPLRKDDGTKRKPMIDWTRSFVVGLFESFLERLP